MLKISRMENPRMYKVDTYLSGRRPKLLFTVENIDIAEVKKELLRQNIDEDYVNAVTTRLHEGLIDVAGFDDKGEVIAS